MLRRIIKRSICASGSGKVPSSSIGFWVATTRKGAGSACVSPSIVTFASCIASSRADWVRGVARLISSATTTLAKIGPGRKSKLGGLLVEIGNTGDIAWQQIGRELNAPGAAAERLRLSRAPMWSFPHRARPRSAHGRRPTWRPATARRCHPCRSPRCESRPECVRPVRPRGRSRCPSVVTSIACGRAPSSAIVARPARSSVSRVTIARCSRRHRACRWPPDTGPERQPRHPLTKKMVMARSWAPGHSPTGEVMRASLEGVRVTARTRSRTTGRRFRSRGSRSR